MELPGLHNINTVKLLISAKMNTAGELTLPLLHDVITSHLFKYFQYKVTKINEFVNL